MTAYRDDPAAAMTAGPCRDALTPPTNPREANRAIANFDAAMNRCARGDGSALRSLALALPNAGTQAFRDPAPCATELTAVPGGAGESHRRFTPGLQLANASTIVSLLLVLGFWRKAPLGPASDRCDAASVVDVPASETPGVPCVDARSSPRQSASRWPQTAL